MAGVLPNGVRVSISIALAADPVALASALAGRGTLHLEREAVGSLRAAEPMLAECLAIRAEHIPASWLTANAQSMLGGIRLRLARLDPALDDARRAELIASARRHLHDGHDGLIAADPAESPLAIPIRQREAVGRLVALYELLDETEPDQGHGPALAE